MVYTTYKPDVQAEWDERQLKIDRIDKLHRRIHECSVNNNLNEYYQILQALWSELVERAKPDEEVDIENQFIDVEKLLNTYNQLNSLKEQGIDITLPADAKIALRALERQLFKLKRKFGLSIPDKESFNF